MDFFFAASSFSVLWVWMVKAVKGERVWVFRVREIWPWDGSWGVPRDGRV